MLGNIPHDWLFDEERVSAVVHHGGAGTTAIGLAKGRPTVVIPFFGDQAFWGTFSLRYCLSEYKPLCSLFFVIGDMIHKAGAGPKPIPHKELNIESLRDAIKFAISPSAKEAAKKMAYQIHEDVNIYFSKTRPLQVLMLCVEWRAEGCRQFLQTSSTVKYEMRFGFSKIGSLVVY